MKPAGRAFTLVELLIVVVILGILVAVVAVRFSNTARDTRVDITLSEAQKLRRHIHVYRVRNNGEYPAVDDAGAWEELVGTDGQHLASPPINAYVGAPNGMIVVIGTEPDNAYHTDYGWIYDNTTGDLWPACFDANDQPLPN